MPDLYRLSSAARITATSRTRSWTGSRTRSRLHSRHATRSGKALLAGLVCLAALGCQPRVHREVISNSTPTAGRGLASDVKVLSYTSPADGLFASSYAVITKEGVVVFDTQMLPEYAAALYKDIRSHSSAPIKAIYITHPHPDHYFGAVELLSKTNADLISTVATAQHIEAEGPSKRTYWQMRYGDRMTKSLKTPELTFNGQRPAGVGGAVLEIKEISMNESPGSLIAWMPQTRGLITGDLVFNGSHLWMAEGHSQQWIEALEALKAYQPATIYPGHGSPGGPELIDFNLRYLRTVQQIVARFVKPGVREMTNAQLEEARKLILSDFPGMANPDFLDLTIPAEYSSQVARMGKAS